MIQATALICTRNRPGQIGKAVRSLLDGAGEVEVIVVDQSSGRESEAALAAWRADPRLTYHRTTSIGKCAGLNEGLRHARGSVCVLTDDDCEAPPGWANAMARILLSQPKVAILFCNVIPVPHDRQAGYVPAHQRSSSRLLTSIGDLRAGLGLGAGMAIRREVALELGGFDASFGPGARFPSADEWDFAIRVLLSGWHVLETPELSVVHDGFRSFEEGRVHARRDWLALGAVCTKAVRGGGRRGLTVPLSFFSREALWPPLSDLLHLRRPRGIGRITAFCSGFAEGMRIPLDARTLLFLP